MLNVAPLLLPKKIASLCKSAATVTPAVFAVIEKKGVIDGIIEHPPEASDRSRGEFES